MKDIVLGSFLLKEAKVLCQNLHIKLQELKEMQSYKFILFYFWFT